MCETVTLSEYGVELRGRRLEDFSMLAKLRRDTEVQHSLMGYPSEHVSDTDVQHWLDRRSSDPSGRFLIIADQKDECVGFVQLVGIHQKGRFAWLGIAIDPAHQGSGFGKGALNTLFQFSSTELGLKKLLLEVLEKNQRAITLYRSLGFRQVGILSDHYRGREHPQSVAIMERELMHPNIDSDNI